MATLATAGKVELCLAYGHGTRLLVYTLLAFYQFEQQTQSDFDTA